MRPVRALPQCDSPSELSATLNGTWRCFSWAELASIASEHAARLALDSGEIVRLAPNAYCGRAHARSLAAKADAVVTWLGNRAAIGGEAALFLANAIEQPPEMVDATVSAHFKTNSRPPWLRVTHASYPVELVGVSGWRVVHPATALCQAYGRMDRRERDGQTLRALQGGRVRAPDVWSALERMPRVRDRRALQQVLLSFEAGAESVLELHALTEVFDGPKFEHMVRQHVITTRGGMFRLDMYDPATQTAFEFDGAAYHRGVDKWQHDRNRDAELAAMGILVVRFTRHDLIETPDWCRQVALRVMRERRRMARR